MASCHRNNQSHGASTGKLHTHFLTWMAFSQLCSMLVHCNATWRCNVEVEREGMREGSWKERDKPLICEKLLCIWWERTKPLVFPYLPTPAPIHTHTHRGFEARPCVSSMSHKTWVPLEEIWSLSQTRKASTPELLIGNNMELLGSLVQTVSTVCKILTFSFTPSSLLLHVHWAYTTSV